MVQVFLLVRFRLGAVHLLSATPFLFQGAQKFLECLVSNQGPMGQKRERYLSATPTKFDPSYKKQLASFYCFTIWT